MNYVFTLIIAASFFVPGSVIQAKELKFDPTKRLYTSDKAGYKVSKLPALLDRLLSNGKPVILFVHGRGNEPKKSLEGGRFIGRAVYKLESGYDANVLMFSWDSKRGKGLKDRGRPLSNMLVASKEFLKILEGIKQYRKSHPQSKPIALISHSMGNIVIESAVKNLDGWIENDGKPLFSNILLSASDADDVEHAEWVEQISATENVYITINADDKVLKKSNDRPSGTAPMGLEPGSKLANKATYVDVTRLGKRKGKKTKKHELFNKPGMYDQVHVCQFFHQVLTGESVILNDDNSTEVVPNKRYKLLHKRSNTNNCFKSIPSPN